MEASREFCEWLVYSLLCITADTLDTVLSSLALNSKIDELSDEEILEHFRWAPSLQPNHHLNDSIRQLPFGAVAKVSQDMVTDMDELASGDSFEANALTLVSGGTSIPVPPVRRVIKLECGHLIVMDHVEGETLAEAWPEFSLWKRICVAFTLRRYISQLRQLKPSPATPPGPLSPRGPQICESPVFGTLVSHRSPFASCADMSAFFNERSKMVSEGDISRELFDDTSLYFSHQDLRPDNFIMDKHNVIWLLDLGRAGFYPKWFEYVAMQQQTTHEEDTFGFRDRFWRLMIPFVCGPYFKQERCMRRIARAFSYA